MLMSFDLEHYDLACRLFEAQDITSIYTESIRTLTVGDAVDYWLVHYSP